MTQLQFIDKLKAIKPLKFVESPPSIKKSNCSIFPKYAPQNQIFCSLSKSLSMKVQPSQTFIRREPLKQMGKATEFSQLSSSINLLFSKIQKIKREFDGLENSGKITNTEAQNIENIEEQSQHSHKTKKLKSSLKINRPTITKPPKLSLQETSISTISITPFSTQSQSLRNSQLAKMHSQIEQMRRYIQKQSLLLPSLANIKRVKKVPSPMKNENLLPQSEYKNQAKEDCQQSPQQSISIEDFELGQCIGSGKFGDVYVCKHRKSGCIYALKKIFKSTIKEYGMENQLIMELRLHYRLRHPNIIAIYAHFHDEFHIFLLMEYASGGMLLDCRGNRQQFVSQKVCEVLSGLDYLHRHQIAHRDLKPQNIVLSFDVAKLCDFGWATKFDTKMKSTFCGTLDYLSPEMNEKGQHTLSVDLWSVGVLTFELLAGFAPFRYQIDKLKAKGSFKPKIRWEELLYPPCISPCAQQFIRRLLKQNPDQRASIRMCLEHQFIISNKVQAGPLEESLSL